MMPGPFLPLYLQRKESQVPSANLPCVTLLFVILHISIQTLTSACMHCDASKPRLNASTHWVREGSLLQARYTAYAIDCRRHLRLASS